MCIWFISIIRLTLTKPPSGGFLIGASTEIRTQISQLSVVTVYKTAVLPLNYRGEIGAQWWYRSTVSELSVQYSTFELIGQFGGSTGGRTLDNQIKSLVLYLLSYTPKICYGLTFKHSSSGEILIGHFKSGEPQHRH